MVSRPQHVPWKLRVAFVQRSVGPLGSASAGVVRKVTRNKHMPVSAGTVRSPRRRHGAEAGPPLIEAWHRSKPYQPLLFALVDGAIRTSISSTTTDDEVDELPPLEEWRAPVHRGLIRPRYRRERVLRRASSSGCRIVLVVHAVEPLEDAATHCERRARRMPRGCELLLICDRSA